MGGWPLLLTTSIAEPSEQIDSPDDKLELGAILFATRYYLIVIDIAGSNGCGFLLESIRGSSDPCRWKRKVSFKKLNFKDTLPNFSGTVCYEHNSSNRKFQTLENPETRKKVGPMLGWAKIGLRLQKNSGGCLV